MSINAFQARGLVSITKLHHYNTFPRDKAQQRETTMSLKVKKESVSRSPSKTDVASSSSDDDEELSQRERAKTIRSVTTDTYYVDLKVTEARGLTPKEKQGTINPYCCVKVEKMKFKTKVMHKSSNPKWTDFFQIPLTHVEKAVLNITIFDKASFGKESLGELNLPISRIKQANREGDWYALEGGKRKDSTIGEVYIVAEFRTTTKDAGTENESAKKYQTRFPDISAEEKLLSTFPAGLHQTGITISGTIYITDNHLCFYASHLGKHWRETILITDIKSMEKEHSILMMPNAISITTNEGKSFWFSQLQDRAKVYDLLSVRREMSGRQSNRASGEFSAPPSTKRISLTKSFTGSPSNKSTDENTSQTELVVRVKMPGDEKYQEVTIDTTRRVYTAVGIICSQFGLASTEDGSNYILCYKKKDKKKTSTKIRMEPQKPLSSYDLPHKAALILSPIDKTRVEIPQLPFTTYTEKFDISDNREDLAMEFAIHCAEFPMNLSDSSNRNPQDVIHALRKGLIISESAFESMSTRADRNGPGVESILIELETRFTNIDNHPYYHRKNFKTFEEYETWWQREKGVVLKQVSKLITTEKHFFATLHLKVVEAESLESKDLNGFSDPFALITIDGQRAKSKTKKKTLEPVWNENFEFQVTSATEPLTIELWDKDLMSSSDFICKLVIPASEMINNGSIDRWFDMEPSGRIKLSIRMEHPYSKYLHKLRDIMALCKHPVGTESNSPKTEVAVDYVAVALLKAKGLRGSSSGIDMKTSSEADRNIMSDTCITGGTVNHNRFYMDLSRALLSYQVREADESIINEDFTAFLEEYSQRFGVSHFFTRVAQLANIEGVFSPSADHIYTIEELLADIVHAKENSAIITLFEERLYRKTCEKLWVHVEEIIKNHTQLFPGNTSPNIMKSVCEVVRYLCDGDEERMTEKIKSYLKASIDEKYPEMISRSKKWASSNQSSDSAYPRKSLTVPQILHLCDTIKEEITTEAVFKKSFPDDIELIHSTTVQYFDLLMEELAPFCEEETSTDAFEIYFRAKKLAKAMNDSEANKKLIQLEKNFVPFVLMWLKEASSKLHNYVDNAFKMDRREALSDSVLHSSAVMDTFAAVFSSLEFLGSLEMRDPFFILNFTEVVCKTAKTFTSKQLEIFRIEVETVEPVKPQLRTGKRTSQRDNHPPFQLTKEHCIAINNVDSARKEMDKFVSELEQEMDRFESSKMNSEANPRDSSSSSPADLFERGTFETCIQETFASMKRDREIMMDVFYNQMRPFIRQYIESSAAQKEGRVAGALLSYLDDQLSVLSDNLYPALFKSVLKYLWVAIVKDLRSLIFPNQGAGTLMTLSEAQQLIQILKKLQDFFYAGGDGLTKETMNENTSTLEKLLGLYETPTRELIVIYTQLKNSNNGSNQANMKSTTIVPTMTADLEGVQSIHPKQILEGRKNDKIAQAFLKEAENPELHQKQQQIRQQFLLPESELILDTYKVTSDKTPGTLVLTTSYLLFDSVFSNSADSEDQIAILLTEIKKVTRLIVISENDERHTFSAYSCTNMMQDIINYAVLAGNKYVQE
ncbi:hypothetical protein PROFUN_03017 [Planoprotostelium fungivorum]|uniref:Uncharacterized protein n=1 Tax=Planoprotostelium fungivorum TaxID=1890364 RepID=A0A2P6NXE4_9EUKA|nr:hypothetical protein PROFUN_03017 [Planoprotostelium fungivorum]